MTYEEACKILHLQPKATEDEINKQFKKLAAKYHPDINKDPEAIQKSKEISEAHQFLKNYKPQQQVNFDNWHGDFININDLRDSFFSNINSRIHVISTKARQNHSPVRLHTTITFAESILGVTKKIGIDKYVKCEKCQGAGTVPTLECSTCNGKGFKNFSKGYSEIRMMCQDCFGSGKKQISCETCSESGVIEVSVSNEVKIPAGVIDKQTVRLSNGGNYSPTLHAIEDAYLKISVIPDKDLQLQGQNVISNLSISLLEALQGTTKEVYTVLGPQTITITPGSRHQEEVIIPQHGVNKIGNHIVKLIVNYPENITGLISYLQNI